MGEGSQDGNYCSALLIIMQLTFDTVEQTSKETGVGVLDLPLTRAFNATGTYCQHALKNSKRIRSD
jgi:hypothetical protein